MFWKFAMAAVTLGAAFLGWQRSGLNGSLFGAILAFSALLSLACYRRWKPWGGVVFGTVALSMTVGYLAGSTWLAAGTAVLAFFAQVLVHDIVQEKHSLERVFPGLAHIRRFAELIRPEIQQYWIERDTEGKPATRDDRSFCYAASKGELTDISFGTKRDYHKPGQIHIRNATFPVPDREPIELPPIVLGPQRRQPAFVWGRLGIGDMSFGSLGRNALEALASGAGKGPVSS